mmetsp:Transcript_14432/g.29953  ORF Transcript_14432/g.29953 Transcript_14432/m.29953 type:complete len:190 (-) Transcript_14432:770-1339(-)
MLRGVAKEENKKTEEEDKENELEEEIIQEILQEGRGEREEKGERDEWKRHVGWHNKEDVGLRRQRQQRDRLHAHEQALEGGQKKYLAKEETFGLETGEMIEPIHDYQGRDGGSPSNQKLIRVHSRMHETLNDSNKHQNIPVQQWSVSPIIIRYVTFGLVFSGFIVSWIIRRYLNRTGRFRQRSIKGRTL